jgi:hypothetical protein
MPKLPCDLDVLTVDEMGKNISGNGAPTHFTSDCECLEWIAPMAGRASASDVTFGWIQHAGARSRDD